MFVHSARVPRLYKDAAKVLQQAKENGGSVKKLIFQSKHRNKKALYALVNETLHRFALIDSLIEKIKLLTKENRFDPWLARILVTELLWGKKKLPDQSTPLKTLIAYHNELEKYKSQLLDSTTSEKKKAKVNKPRVVRVNTLVTSVENAVTELKNEDWKLVPFAGESYEDFVSQTALLKKGEFMVDLHFKELLQFPFNTEFYKHNAYKNGLLVLQDKASCLPTLLLNPEPGSIVLDMCAAPGMKTTHLAALLNNQGSIYAIERDAKRFETLNAMVKKLGATCVKTINKDVLKVTEKDCLNVKYILVDPSCSGSGMTDRIEFNKNSKPTEERLEKLAGFQILILKHALKHFPQAQRVVYSTCSIYSKENEYVVQEVLKNDLDFKLVNAHNLLKGSWTSNNSDENWKGITENCLCMKPEKDLTNGFFVAVFERTGNNQQKKLNKKNTKAKDGNNKEKKQKINNADVSDKQETTGNVKDENKKKKKQTKQEKIETLNETADISVNFEATSKKKKSKKHKTIGVELEVSRSTEHESNVIDKSESNKKSKKRNQEPIENLDGAIPEKKKSKKHDKTVANIESSTPIKNELSTSLKWDNISDINDIIGQMLESTKKSKIQSEVTKDNTDIGETPDTFSSKKKKSKKHKNSSGEIGIATTNTDYTNEQEALLETIRQMNEEVGVLCKSSTKKKKRKHSGSVNENIFG